MTEMTNDWYSPEASTFGDRLQAAREAAGLSQESLAKRLGVKTKTLRNWEEDIAEPRANRLTMMAGVLGVSITWLLHGEGEGIDAPEETPSVDPGVLDLLGEVRALQVQMRGNAERLARLEKALRRKLNEGSNG